MRAIGDSGDALLRCIFVYSCCCSKSFWDSPLVEGPVKQVHPKTTTFCLVLGFTPSGRPSRAHQSQNDFEQRYSGTSVDLPGPVSPPPGFPDVSHQDEKRHSTHFQLLIYHIRKLRDIISLQKVVGEVFIPWCHFTRYVSTKERNWSGVRW